ncbi:MAG: hypothetical protein J7L71_11000, partial [Spirochaetaceae bacterium]|nr:hypothetical protein [Spirochaetaceae bacterium]
MKIGVIFNPGAGGIGRYKGIGRVIEDVFSGHELITGSALFGSSYISASEVVGEQLTENFQENMDNNLKPFIAKRVDMIIAVGGDGLLT